MDSVKNVALGGLVALSIALQGLEENPQNLDLRYLEGRAHMAMESWQPAEIAFVACLKAPADWSPRDPAIRGAKTRTSLAVVLIKRGQMDDARKQLEAAVEEERKDSVSENTTAAQLLSALDRVGPPQ